MISVSAVAATTLYEAIRHHRLVDVVSRTRQPMSRVKKWTTRMDEGKDLTAADHQVCLALALYLPAAFVITVPAE